MRFSIHPKPLGGAEGAFCLPEPMSEGSGRRNAVISIAAGVFMLAVLGIITLGQGAFSFAYSQNALWPTLWLLPAALAALLLLAWFRNREATFPGRKQRWSLWLAAYFAALLAVQLLVTRGIWFYPGWDVVNVYTTAGQIARGEAFDGAYFRLCPNNAPLTVLLAAPLWVASRLYRAVPYAALPYLGALMVNLACALCMACVLRLTVSRAARLTALFLCTVWIALSLVITVPYTDAFAIVFPILALTVYLTRLRPFFKWGLISLVCFFGASIKPTVLIVEIAMLVILLLRAFPLRKLTAARLRRAGIILLAVALGAVPGRLWQNAATAYLAGSAQPQEQLSETHYLMLGMNGATFGGHSPEDVVFSTSFATLAERRAANLQRAWERVSSRDVAQNLYFFAVKAYKAFSDGTFAANRSYLALETPARADVISRTAQQVFYRRGSLNPLHTTVEQGVWLLVLLLCAAALLGRRRRDAATAVLGLTIVGVGAYLLLFEVWPRYLYLYAPLFVALAAVGADSLRLPTRRGKKPETVA